MKKAFLLSMCLFLAVSMTANAAVIMQLNFDGAPAVDLDPYVAGSGDIIPTDAVIGTQTLSGWGGGWATNTPNAPSIVTQIQSMQGGQALAIGADGNEGYNVALGEGRTSDSVTIEILVKCDAIDSTLNEYQMMTFIGNESPEVNNCAWSIRTLGSLSTPNGEVQLMTNEGGENNYFSGSAPPIDSMVHWAVLIDRSANTMDLYKAGTLLGGVSVTFPAAKVVDILSIGNFMNPAGSSRSLVGRIDALCISEGILTPANFVLPKTTTAVNDWEIY
jgi:hypothetical protein